MTIPTMYRQPAPQGYAYVYCLVNQWGTISYVGRTRRSLIKRLREHRYRRDYRWYEIRLIDTVPAEEAAAAELATIQLFRERGCSLWNKPLPTVQ